MENKVVLDGINRCFAYEITKRPILFQVEIIFFSLMLRFGIATIVSLPRKSINSYNFFKDNDYTLRIYR